MTIFEVLSCLPMQGVLRVNAFLRLRPNSEESEMEVKRKRKCSDKSGQRDSNNREERKKEMKKRNREKKRKERKEEKERKEIKERKEKK